VRDMHKRLPVTTNKTCPVRSLGDGIVPVFHPPTLVKEDVSIICNITSSKNAWLICFQVFIHDKAVFDDKAGICKEFRLWSRANAGDDQVAGNCAPARQYRGTYSVLTFQPDNAFPFEQLNTTRDVVALKKFRHWGCEHPTPNAIFSND